MTNNEIMDLYDSEIAKGGSADSVILRTVKIAFEAGAASRDAEIAELNRRIDYWRDTARKYLVPETQVRKP